MGSIEQKSRGWLTVAKANAATLGTGVAVLWGVEVVDTVLFSGGLDAFGVVPRSIEGLWGILAAPFLHGSFSHLAVNTVSLVVLGALAMVRSSKDFWVVTLVGTLTAGLGPWLVGAPGTVHIGASGVVFAYLGFLMARGFVERRVGSVVMSVVVAWVFGGMLWGLIPYMQAGVSWEAHVFGFIGGLISAKLLKR
jgi:membrane associated rhomboid family serine protease